VHVVTKPGIEWISPYRSLNCAPSDPVAHAALVARAHAAMAETAPLLLEIAHAFGIAIWIDESPSFEISAPNGDGTYKLIAFPEVAMGMLAAKAEAARHDVPITDLMDSKPAAGAWH
jgi:hypothetical protein